MRKYLYVPLAVAVLATISGDASGASIAFPPVEVTSLAHSYTYKAVTDYGTAWDYFNILGGTGSAVTTTFVADLSTADTFVSVSLAAPAGKKFVFTVPSGATYARFRAAIFWTSEISSPAETLWMPPVTFEGLSGPAPFTPPGSTWTGTLGADWIVVDFSLQVSGSFEFTAVRIDLAVPTGGLSSWSKTYIVRNASCEAYASGPGMPDQVILSIVDIPAPADTTAPTITINTPSEGATYLLDQVVPADWTATDAESGIASAVGTIESGQPIDTSTVDAKTFTVTASDNAGNSVELTTTYQVHYGVGGLQTPYAEGKAFQIGSTIPLKWQYTNATGSAVPSSAADPKVWLTLVDTWTSEEEATPITAPGESGCQYDSASDGWQQNWTTAGPQGTRYIWITCASGQCDGPYPIELRE